MKKNIHMNIMLNIFFVLFQLFSFDESAIAAGEPAGLDLTVDHGTIIANQSSTCLVTAIVCDSGGNRVTNSTATITFRLDGVGGKLIGTNPIQAVDGVATIIYLSGIATGTVVISATSPGVSSGSIVIKLVGDHMTWFRNAKFGMFIHWGLYSLLERGEWVMWQEQIPPSQYEQLITSFNPVNYNPQEWVLLARAAGMKYITLTTKHHEGFCMFNSTLTNYNCMNTPGARDYIKNFIISCNESNMRVFLYYSLLDWHHPDYLPKQSWMQMSTTTADMDRYVNYMIGQLRELCTNYGKIDGIWFDGDWDHGPTVWRSEEFVSMIRQMQPGIILNGRCALPCDYDVFEHAVPENPLPRGRLWEVAMVINESYGYNKSDVNYKTVPYLVQALVTAVSKGGNVLLNVGPKPDGTIQPEFVSRLQAIGTWMSVNKDAIYGCDPSPFRKMPWGGCTVKGNRLFLHVYNPLTQPLIIDGLKNNILSAYVLEDNTPVMFAQNGVTLSIMPPQITWNPNATVIVLETDGIPDVENIIRRTGYGTFELMADDANLNGTEISYNNEGYIGTWWLMSDYVSWNILVDDASEVSISLTYSCENGTAGGEYTIDIDGQRLTGTTKGTGGWSNYQTEMIGKMTLPAGKHTVSLRYTNRPPGVSALMNLKKITLTMTTPPPPVDHGLQYDGINDFVRFDHSAKLNVNSMNASGLTIEMWVKPAKVMNYSTLVSYFEWAVGGYKIFLYNNTVNVWAFPAGGFDSTATLATGQWNHVAVQFGTRARLFINGKQQSVTNTMDAMPGPCNAPFIIGATSGLSGEFFSGVIDEIRISSCVRYTADFAPSTAPFSIDPYVVALWHFNEGVGNVVLDAGPNNITGFINGASWVFAGNKTTTSSTNTNVSPTVFITNPVNGATYYAPATIALSAIATDADGSITNVRFYRGTTLLATDTASPYEYAWADVSSGTYQLRAVAQDNQGATSTSTVVTVTVLSSSTPPVWYTLSATANPANGGTVSPASGTYLAGSQIQVTATPNTNYTFTNWSGDVTGTNPTITITMDGNKSITANFTYVPPANSSPTVSITSPNDGATYTAPASIAITATATDSDGTITVVRFYSGTTLLGTDNASPYEYTWTGVPAGSYLLTAQAEDNGGAVGISGGVTVTVNPAAQPPQPVLQPGEVRVVGGPAGYINATVNPNVTIRYRRTSAGIVTVKVYDLRGRLVMEKSKDGPAGIDDEVVWNAAEIPAGVYVVRMTATGVQRSVRIAVTK